MPRCHSIFRLLVIAMVAAACGASARAAATVRAALERSTVMAGETVALQIIVEGGTPQSAENFPPIQGLAIQYQGHQQQFTSVQGQNSFRHVLTYGVSSAQPGDYEIPSIRVMVDGMPLPTLPLRLSVTKSDIPAQNRHAFLRLIVPKTSIFVGEIVPIEVQLYVTSADNIQQPQLDGDGFVIHKQAQHTQSRTQIGQEIYNIFSFKMSVSAAKAGKLNLGPAKMSLSLRVAVPRDPNDLFGMFSRTQRREITVASPPVEMNVQPLPPNAPPEFNGAIGKFSWTIEAAPTNLNAGGPITLRIAVAGAGNLDNLKLPDFSWPEFKSYAPSSAIQSQHPLALEGARTFEQVVAPQNAAIREIPELKMAYFDPAQAAYVRLSHPAIPISVQPASAAPAVPTVARAAGEDAPPEEQDRTDIVHIKMETGPMAAIRPPLVDQPWFLWLQLAPIAAYAGATLWRKRQDQLARNPRLRRRIQVQRTIQAGLADLQKLAAENRVLDFYSLVFRLLQEQLGERLDLPASAITEAVLDERLPARGASPELIAQLHALFQLCNQARYAPVQTNAELLAVEADLGRALQALQQLPE
jgi:hypothetical protein